MVTKEDLLEKFAKLKKYGSDFEHAFGNLIHEYSDASKDFEEALVEYLNKEEK